MLGERHVLSQPPIPHQLRGSGTSRFIQVPLNEVIYPSTIVSLAERLAALIITILDAPPDAIHLWCFVFAR